MTGTFGGTAAMDGELDFRTRVIQVLAIETAVRYGVFSFFVDIQPVWVRVSLAVIAVMAVIVAVLVRRANPVSHLPGRVLIVASMFVVTALSLAVTTSDLAVITSFSLLGLTLSSITLDSYRAGVVVGLIGTSLAVFVAVARSTSPLAVVLIYVGLFVTGSFLILRLRQFLELARDQAVSQANSDSLTGLLNRRGMETRVPELDSEANALGKRIGCLVLDLDHFKSINDSFGHHVGDLVLIRAAKLLNDQVRTPDIVVRTGGEEFAVFALVNDELELARLANRLHAALRASAIAGARAPEPIPAVTASIGGSVGRAATPSDLSTLFRRADRLLYDAKRAGRDTIRIQSSSQLRKDDTPMVAEPGAEASLIAEVREGVRNHSVTVAYQPIVDLQRGQIMGYEALARFTDRLGAPVSPPTLIAIARQLGLLDELTLQIATRAFADMAAFMRLEPQARALHLNVEGPQIHVQSLFDGLRELRREHPMVALRLEFTEASLTHFDDEALNHMKVLTEEGFVFALDDYGQDQADAAALLRLPVSSVKIDKIFLADETNTRHRIILGSFSHLITALRMEAVVEGVETRSGHDTARDLGIGFAQGYLYGRPATAGDTLARLSASGLRVET
ncbi:EAL domain-containing protein [Subtercola boreus]|uniref:GGDEF-domain containing protein n=1 Tax=Subtercola boreus TaxID=120213 RepID=A0A3E0WFD0_9MICO|nr:EAL domain-containing protein [Subtercola boreus]RFA22546.1 hypothetical protein B7R24_02665 [Subtercola boreus]RFA22902.1 hypothetical protein B7R23_02660 [Subtercola boreus]RFA28654.1 hypothetical protein B7R25_02675 [Subtercola boreus]